MRKKKKEQDLKKKMKIVFCVLSIMVIVYVIGFYANRTHNFYLTYNKNVLGNVIKERTNLVEKNHKYYYVGNSENNYLVYNNMLWRIVNIDDKGMITIIMDDYLNMLPWDSDSVNYNASEINKYLNDYVLANLNKKYLAKINICEDKIDEFTNFTCKNAIYDKYISLLDINDFLNTIDNNTSFLVKENEVFWLLNRSSEKVWHTNGAGLSQSFSNSIYEIKPVVKLNSAVEYVRGDGTKEDPYLLSSINEITIGSKIKLGNDFWTVYDTRDNYRLIKDELLTDSYRYDLSKTEFNISNNSSLAEYLNTTYYDQLSYNNLILKNSYYDGEYDNAIYDVLNSKKDVYIAIPNMLDIKYNSSLTNYYLATGMEGLALIYSNPIYASEVTEFNKIRPCITIKKTLNFKYIDNYYEIEM